MNYERKHTRLTAARPVEIRWGDRLDYGVIVNESKGGVFINASGKFMIGAPFKLTYINSGSIRTTRKGRIVRIEPKGIAVQFDNPDHAGV